MKKNIYKAVILGIVVLGSLAPSDQAFNGPLPNQPIFQANNTNGAIPTGLNYGFEPGSPCAPAWASVVRGAGNSTKNVRAVVNVNTTPAVQIKVKQPNPNNRLDVTPKNQNLTDAETVMTLWGGNAPGDPLLEQVVPGEIEAADTGNGGAVLDTLTVAMLPELESIPVAIFRVWDSISEMPAGGQPGVHNTPANNEIVEELNKIYTQAGVRFSLDANGSEDLALRYDDIQPSVNDRMVTDAEMNQVVAQLQNKPGKLKIVLMNRSNMDYASPDPNFKVAAQSLQGAKISFLFIQTILNRPGEVVKTVAAHEIGHLLDLTCRNADAGGHDTGAAPQGTDLLMKPGTPVGGNAPTLGRWLPHEDWIRANERAKVLLQP